MAEVDRTACTLVSLIPYELREEKPGVFPGLYVIPKAKDNDFEVLVIEEASTIMFVGGDKVNIQIPLKASEVARSLVQDYCIAQLAFNEDAHPGLFYVPGRHDRPSILKNHATELADARQKQRNWFMALVRLADDDWAQYHRHKTISKLQRFACTSLKLEREWSNEAATEEIKMCPGCMTQVHPLAAICASCNTVINEEAFKKLKRAV